jgi:acyl dehydratase
MASRALLPAWEITADEFLAGARFETMARTVTESDVVSFAGLTGDLNPQHVDAEWTRRNSRFGQRIAHGLLIGSIAVGMIPPRIRALGKARGVQGVFKSPVLFGDTMRVVGGLLTHRANGSSRTPAEWRVLNQDDVLCARIRWEYDVDESEQLVDLGDEPLTPTTEMSLQESLTGKPYRSVGRTITEAHVVQFMSITGDYSPEYSDAEWAKSNMRSGQRMVPEMLTVSMGASLFPLDVQNLIAARKSRFRFHQPMAIGDTMYVEGRYMGGEELADEVVQGAHAFRCVNQHGDLLTSLILYLVMG